MCVCGTEESILEVNDRSLVPRRRRHVARSPGQARGHGCGCHGEDEGDIRTDGPPHTSTGSRPVVVVDGSQSVIT